MRKPGYVWKLLIWLSLFIFSSLLSGCASSQPQASPEQIQAIMGALGGRNQQQQVRPAIDFSVHPTIGLRLINNDSFGLRQTLCNCLEEMGIQLVDDSQNADVILTGNVQYVGDPDDRPSQFNDIKKKAQVTRTAGAAARLGMGMASPFELISGGARLLASTATKALEPNRLQGIVVIHVRQGNQIWDVNLDHTVEASEEVANQQLATEMSHSIISQLGG